MLQLRFDNQTLRTSVAIHGLMAFLLLGCLAGDVMSADETDNPKIERKEKKAWAAGDKKAWKEAYGKELKSKDFRPEKFYKPGKLEKSQMKQFRKQEKKDFAAAGLNKKELRSDVVANRSPYAPAVPFRQLNGERLTTDLPAAYSSLDVDTDGQIGLYEWITLRRSELDLFDTIDLDRDGLLTPTELNQFEKADANEGQLAVDFSRRYQRPRLQVIGGTWNLTARSNRAPTREELPEAYNPGAGKTKEDRAKLHQKYVDQRMAKLSSSQRARIKQLWDEKQKNDPKMANRGASFVRIMEHVAENEKQQ